MTSGPYRAFLFSRRGKREGTEYMPLFRFHWKREKKGISRIPLPFDPCAKDFVPSAEIQDHRESVSYLENRILQSKSKTSEAAGGDIRREKTKRHTLVSHPEESGDG